MEGTRNVTGETGGGCRVAERYDLYQATASALSQLGPRRESTEQQAIARAKDAWISAEGHRDRVRATCREHQEARSEAERGVGEVLASRPLKRLRSAIGAMAGCDAGAAFTASPGYLQTLREGYEGSRASIEQLADGYVELTKRQGRMLGGGLFVSTCLFEVIGAASYNEYISVIGVFVFSLAIVVLIQAYGE
jgi:hypothetical protein